MGETNQPSQLPISNLQREILKMQNEAASRAKWTQTIILLMTSITFVIGVTFVIMAIVQIVYYKEYLFGSIYSLGGLGAVLATVLYKPMQKAQNSINDLVQLQIAYLSFNSKVTLWTEFVTARAKLGTGLEIERVKEATIDIENASSKALEQIEKYCD